MLFAPKLALGDTGLRTRVGAQEHAAHLVLSGETVFVDIARTDLKGIVSQSETAPNTLPVLTAEERTDRCLAPYLDSSFVSHSRPDIAVGTAPDDGNEPLK
jgi:hypothetical protein